MIRGATRSCGRVACWSTSDGAAAAIRSAIIFCVLVEELRAARGLVVMTRVEVLRGRTVFTRCKRRRVHLRLWEKSFGHASSTSSHLGVAVDVGDTSGVGASASITLTPLILPSSSFDDVTLTTLTPRLGGAVDTVESLRRLPPRESVAASACRAFLSAARRLRSRAS